MLIWSHRWSTWWTIYTLYLALSHMNHPHTYTTISVRSCPIKSMLNGVIQGELAKNPVLAKLLLCVRIKSVSNWSSGLTHWERNGCAKYLWVSSRYWYNWLGAFSLHKTQHGARIFTRITSRPTLSLAPDWRGNTCPLSLWPILFQFSTKHITMPQWRTHVWPLQWSITLKMSHVQID